MCPRSRTPLRATIVALAVLVLVPAWVARTATLYACPSEGRVAKTSCCPVSGATAKAKRDAARRQLEPRLAPACCSSDEVSLVASRPSTASPEAAVAPSPDVVVIAEVVARAARFAGRVDDVAPRATGPPTWLAHRSLLL